MTAKETLYHVAKLAFDAGLVDRELIQKLTRKKNSKRNMRHYYRAMQVLKGSATGLGPIMHGEVVK